MTKREMEILKFSERKEAKNKSTGEICVVLDENVEDKTGNKGKRMVLYVQGGEFFVERFLSFKGNFEYVNEDRFCEICDLSEEEDGIEFTEVNVGGEGVEEIKLLCENCKNEHE